MVRMILFHQRSSMKFIANCILLALGMIIMTVPALVAGWLFYDPLFRFCHNHPWRTAGVHTGLLVGGALFFLLVLKIISYFMYRKNPRLTPQEMEEIKEILGEVK
jgi:phosphotransferase system  glucose/maltose/N-acetylglucosamine-specific IIC component